MLSSEPLLNGSMSTSSVSAEFNVFPTLSRNPTYCNLQVAYLNCRSVLAHIGDVPILAWELCIDVLALWLDNSVLDSELSPCHCGFSIVHKDCNHRGGGIVVMLADNVRFAIYSDLCHDSIEILWLYLFPGCKRSILLCCVYRPPSQMAFSDDVLQECENSLVGKTQKLLIVGDL